MIMPLSGSGSQMTRIIRERMRFEPQRTGRDGGVKPGFLPPSGFVTTAMHLAMVPSTQRDCELIADLAPERPVLGETQMMRVRRAATADEARLLGNMADMLAIADASRLWMGEGALINAGINGFFVFCFVPRVAGSEWASQSSDGDDSHGLVNGKAQKLGAKDLFNVPGIGSIEPIFFRHNADLPIWWPRRHCLSR